MGKMREKKGSWVVAGGKADEIAHCTRCGQGLVLGTQLLTVAAAAMKAFVNAHKHCQATHEEPIPRTPHEWLRGRDTGTSSLTIWSVITGKPSPHREYAAPRDPQDFGRCYRLLKLFPEWRSKLDSVSAACPEFKPFIDNWDKLSAMYEAAVANDDGGAMYEEMKKLEAGEIANA